MAYAFGTIDFGSGGRSGEISQMEILKASTKLKNLNETLSNMTDSIGQNVFRRIDNLQNLEYQLESLKKTAEDTTLKETITKVKESGKTQEERIKTLKALEEKQRTNTITEDEKEKMEFLKKWVNASNDNLEALANLQEVATKAYEKALEQAEKEKIFILEQLRARRVVMEGTNNKDALKKVFSINNENISSVEKFFREQLFKKLAQNTKITEEELAKYENLKEADQISYTSARKAGMSRGQSIGFGIAGVLASNPMEKALNLKSGSELGPGSGGLANTVISSILGPIGTLLLAALNRFNEIGKKGLELFEGTAGRYGYSEGYDKREARDFINFQAQARFLSAEYAVNLEKVEEAFKGLSEYSGVRTFDQLKSLAEATLEISNATGLATSSVTQLGAAYQKNFGLGSQEAVTKAGQQLLGLMNNVNRGLTSNLLVTNAEMADLVKNLMQGTQGADIRKTLIPFIDTAYSRIKALGIESRVVSDLLRDQMLGMKKTGEGLPQGFSSFILGAGNLFTNQLTGRETGIASQVGKGKFAYEQGREMAKIKGPGQEFWSSEKLILRNDLVDLAFKLKGGDLSSLLASQSDAALGQITSRIFELYQIPGAEQAIGVSQSEIVKRFSDIARRDPLQFKLLGGDLDKLTALSEYSQAEEIVRTGKVNGITATEQQMKDANAARKNYVMRMTPVDRTNQILEMILGTVDYIVSGIGDVIDALHPLSDPGTDYAKVTMGGLSTEESQELFKLNRLPQRDAEQQKQLDNLRDKQNYSGTKEQKVNSVTGQVTETTTIVLNPGYAASLVAAINNGGV